MSETPPIVDALTGIAYKKEDSLWLDGRDIQAILDSYLGLNVKLFISHKPDEGPQPPYFWSVHGTGVLLREGDFYILGDEPFNLQPMVGYNCVFSVVNMEFEIVSLEELNNAPPSDMDEIVKREERLRSALQNLSSALGSIVGDKE